MGIISTSTPGSSSLHTTTLGSDDASFSYQAPVSPKKNKSYFNGPSNSKPVSRKYDKFVGKVQKYFPK
jgi:hypothetical protein